MTMAQEAKAAKGTSGFAQGKLRALVERIERLEEEKAALGADIREIYSEAKGQASTPRSCAKWCAFESSTRPTGKNKRRCSIFI